MDDSIEEYYRGYLSDSLAYEREHAAPMRHKMTLQEIGDCAGKRVLEVGCGMAPMFKRCKKFRRWTVVEPAAGFFRAARQAGRRHSLSARIRVARGFFEEVAATLRPGDFDVILLSGLLHEVKSPRRMLRAAAGLAHADTLIYGCVPNARSFHRLLAVEMGLIESVFEPSELQRLLRQPRTFDMRSFRRLFRDAGFRIVSAGTQAFKPFTHQQMRDLWKAGLLTPQMADGLANMTRHCPALGSEIFIIAQKAADSSEGKSLRPAERRV